MRERLGLASSCTRPASAYAPLNNIASPAAGAARRLRHHGHRLRRGLGEHRRAAQRAAGRASPGTSSRCAPPRPRATSPPSGRCARASRRPRELADPATSFFTAFVAGPGRRRRARRRRRRAARVRAGARARRRRPPARPTATLAEFLRDELAPQAPEEDAVGRERYALWSRYFLGATVDLDETYAVGPGGARPRRRRAGEVAAADRRARRERSRTPSRRASTPTRRARCTAPPRSRSGCRRRPTPPSPR